jgi:hypothetical protein
MVYTVLSPCIFIFFWSCGYVVIVFLFCKQWYDWIFATVFHIRQRGLKDTERKPLGHLYLGVTHTTMSSAVQTLTPWNKEDNMERTWIQTVALS